MATHKTPNGLNIYYKQNSTNEIGIDEAGRGPMFGRVYTAAVVLPKNNEDFDHSDLKDSKKFTSKKKIQKLADYIKDNAIAWTVQYEDEKSIDKINIRQATLKAMHKCVDDMLNQLDQRNQRDNSDYQYQLLIDGNDFKPYMQFDKTNMRYSQMPHICIEGGDNKYTAIAAASILAKTERDNYIDELCEEYPDLKEK